MHQGNITQVEFNEEEHRYTYNGRELKGITSVIARRLGKSFPKTAAVELACSYGSQIHKESERWIEEGKLPDTENGKWVVSELMELRRKAGNEKVSKYSAEVRVSDFEGTASNVDVVLHLPEGVFLADIKTGTFDRPYCTLQLNAYRLMYENCYDEKVLGMFVLSTKARRLFTVFACDDGTVLRLLEANK